MALQSKKVKFTAVGDVNLGDHPVCVGYGVHSRAQKKGYEYFFAGVDKVLSKADITFGNLESILSLKGYKRNSLKTMELRSDPAAVKGLLSAGFNVINVANNHALQHGADTFRESVDVLRRHNIKTVGLSRVGSGSCVPVIIEKNGLRIGFLGYAFEPDKYYKEKLLYAFGVKSQIQSDIKIIRNDVHILIVSCHWGVEFINRPSLTIIKLARELIDYGVDVVIGHHPHVLQGIERYKKGIIAYSLGNFVGDMLWNKRLRETLILQMELSAAGVSNINCLPVFINDNYQPELLPGARSEELLSRINGLSKALEGETYDEWKRKDKAYLEEFNSLRLKNRKENHRYFLSNLWKYPPSLLVQSLLGVMGRRIRKLFKVSLKSRYLLS